MRRFSIATSVLPALFFAGGCATSSNRVPEQAPERILAVDGAGQVIRQSTTDEHSTATFAAPMERVWRALVSSYAEAGIDPTISDPGAGRHGSASFVVPRRLLDKPIWQYFDCGVGLNGRLAENGRITALIITTLLPQPDGTTSASTQVTASLRRTDSATGTLLNCASTGAIEEFLRGAISKRLSASR